jgi:GH24 family phage-related lysozyme (muramidase)
MAGIFQKGEVVSGMNIHPDAYALIEEQEMFMAEPYQDNGGRMAQGFGHSVGPPDIGGVWTIDYAREVLRNDCERSDRGGALRKWLIENGLELTDRQFGACVSLIYNRGWSAFLKTKVAHYLLAKNETNHLIKAACAFVEEENMRAKDKITGELRVFLGLKQRRIREAALFLTKDK